MTPVPTKSSPCPVCGKEFRMSEWVAVCTSDGVPHHVTCWNKGSNCSACRGKTMDYEEFRPGLGGKNVCPVMSPIPAERGARPAECIRGACAIWVEPSKQCALKVLAEIAGTAEQVHSRMDRLDEVDRALASLHGMVAKGVDRSSEDASRLVKAIESAVDFARERVAEGSGENEALEKAISTLSGRLDETVARAVDDVASIGSSLEKALNAAEERAAAADEDTRRTRLAAALWDGARKSANGLHESASRQFSTCLELVRTNEERQLVLNQLGAARVGAKSWTSAREALNEALELGDDCAAVHANLGVLHMQQQRRDAARACFEKACELEPDDARHRCNLALALYAEGMVGAAVARWKEALEIDPWNVVARESLVAIRAMEPAATPADPFTVIAAVRDGLPEEPRSDA